MVTPDVNGATYLDRDTLPRDPWGNEYEYRPPEGVETYVIVCYGADGVPGGDGDDRDYSFRDLKNEPRE